MFFKFNRVRTTLRSGLSLQYIFTIRAFTSIRYVTKLVFLKLIFLFSMPLFVDFFILSFSKKYLLYQNYFMRNYMYIYVAWLDVY